MPAGITPAGAAAAVTVTSHAAVLPPSVVITVMVAFPAFTAVILPAASTVATPVLLELHVTALFSASAGAAVAVIVSVAFSFSDSVALLIVTPVTETGAGAAASDAATVCCAALLADGCCLPASFLHAIVNTIAATMRAMPINLKIFDFFMVSLLENCFGERKGKYPSFFTFGEIYHLFPAQIHFLHETSKKRHETWFSEQLAMNREQLEG
jgi:hypothetical protein